MSNMLIAGSQDESRPTTLAKKGKPKELAPKDKPTKTRKEVKEFKLPPIHATKPKPKDHRNSYPLTESRKIGWQSTRPQFQLDIYGQGPYSRGLGDLCKIFKWPREGI